MKMALVCDDLSQFGGQERLVVDLIRKYPQAQLHTSLITKEWKHKLDGMGVSYKTTFMQRLPLKKILNKLYGAFLLHVFAFESFDFSDYDIVLSVSSRFAHHIITKPTTKHVCYMNSPGRMFWDPAIYFQKKWLIHFLSPVFLVFRVCDYVASKRVDRFIANATLPKQRIREYYNRDSSIVYPYTEINSSKSTKEGKYYLVISRLVSWKRIDTVVTACSKGEIPVKIVGSGPDLSRLKSLATSNVEFLGWVSEEDKYNLLSECIALIHPQKEDFGITPLESMSMGKPVIAYKDGGATETVTSKTGEFYDEQTWDSLLDVLKNFDPKKYDPNECKKRAKDFSKEKFMEGIRTWIGFAT